MKKCRAVVAVIAVILLGLAAPLAVAADNCMAMGAMCEGPCGSSSCAVAQFVGETSFDPALPDVMQSTEHIASVTLQVPELPPKSLSRSA